MAVVDHLADVKKYANGSVNEAAVAGLLKTYRLVLSKADTRYVACADPAERERVRKSFLEKKLGLAPPISTGRSRRSAPP